MCSPEIAADRFSARKRHDGHLDRDKRTDELVANFAQLSAHGPLGLGPLVSVDTCQAIDYEDAFRQLEDYFSTVLIKGAHECPQDG